MENKKENTLKVNYNQAFTLIELLIVIGIIAILAATVIMLVSPGEKLAEARDATRLQHLNQIESALYVYKVDNGSFPEDITTTLTEICNTNLESPDCTDLVDLSSLNMPTLPVDSLGGITENGTGYKVGINSNRLIFSAPQAEIETIAIGEESITWACGDDITDSRDGNVYPTVQIGTQCWMAKNLAYLPSVVGPATGSETTPYYYVHGYNGTSVATAKATTSYQTYGVLYNHPSALTACPTGFHLPTDAEQHTLEDYLSEGTCNGDRASGYWDCDPAGAKLAGGFSLWTDDVLRNHTNFGETGFNALPSGTRFTDGSFYGPGLYSSFWSSSASSSSAWRWRIWYFGPWVYRDFLSRAGGYSVRCVRD